MITLREIDAPIFESCLEWIYTGSCSIGEADLVKMIDAAAMLVVAPLTKAAALAIEMRIDAENCLAIWTLAVRYELAALRETSKAAAVANFSSLPRESLCELDEGQLVYLLGHDDLDANNSNTNEVLVWDTLMAWAKSANRLPVAALRAVRFALLPEAYLRDIVHAEPLMQTVEAMQVLAMSMQVALFHGKEQRRTKFPCKFTETHRCVLSEDGAKVSAEDRECLLGWRDYAYTKLPRTPSGN